MLEEEQPFRAIGMLEDNRESSLFTSKFMARLRIRRAERLLERLPLMEEQLTGSRKSKNKKMLVNLRRRPGIRNSVLY
jgi:hypothetical protein